MKQQTEWHSEQFPTQELIYQSLSIGAVILRPQKPFRWASGYCMPLYNDNRRLLALPAARAKIAELFSRQCSGHQVDVIAGTATAGIPHATSLADRLKLPLCYIRSSVKSHGTQQKIEGAEVKSKQVVLVEDLISTGASALDAIAALRAAGGRVAACLAIFSYGFQTAIEAFNEEGCPLRPLISFEDLLSVAVASGIVTREQQSSLEDWHRDPFTWGERHGFTRSAEA